MTEGSVHKGFVIDGLTRTGSTTLSRVLGCHPEIKCLMEPFHPQRYDGQFHRMALEAQSVVPALKLIWHRWSGLKHVWEANGWPFVEHPELNDGIVLYGGPVVFLQRRNLLRRYISSFISSKLRFWVGTRDQFEAHFDRIQLPTIEPIAVLEAIKRDLAATAGRLQLFEYSRTAVIRIFYEDLYSKNKPPAQQFEDLNRILNFLGFTAMPEKIFKSECMRLLDQDVYRWSSAELYRRIPGIEQIERQVGSDETGWLFQ